MPTAKSPRARVLLVANHRLTSQWSMMNCATYIDRALRPDYLVETLTPPACLARLPLGSWRRFGVYIDVYLIAGIQIALLSPHFDLVVAVDHGYAPVLWGVRRRKRTAFVHDLIAARHARQHVPETPPAGRFGVIYQAWIVTALKSIQVLAVNTSVLRDQLRALGVAADVVEVGQPTANFRFEHPTTNSEPLACNYLLHVGGDNWIKNKTGLIAIFEALFENMGELCPDLVLAGATTAATRQRAADGPAAHKIKFEDAPTDARLGDLLRAASALISVSRDEGFGVPPLEALAAGTRVALSDIPVFRHIYGDAATYIGLDEPRHAAATLRRALEDAPPNGEIVGALLERYGFPAFAMRVQHWISCCLALRRDTQLAGTSQGQSASP